MADDAFAVARQGRRRANGSVARPHYLQMRLSGPELEMLTALSEAQGVSKQAVLMRAVLAGGTDAAALYERLLEEVANTRSVLATVANNANQLAHQANAFALTGGTPVQTEDVLALVGEVRAVMRRVDDVAGKVGA